MGRRLLHRDDPAKAELIGNIKVTREDWLGAALDALIDGGEEQVKVKVLGERMGVSRSSFYWYFDSRQDLLDALLDHWQHCNTAALIAQSRKTAATITEAVCNVHHCVIDAALFDNRLDFAIRDWAKRDVAVRAVLTTSEEARVQALTEMFERFDYAPTDAFARARVLYFMQAGYDAAELGETLERRLSMAAHYLRIFTGVEPQPKELQAFADFVRAVDARDSKTVAQS
ncbi:TetR family transcriptional regulator [Litoreibacter ponti]|uniref:TetR family transcriptional regulator n=1 Tax=Litoreibacter ponti TaxID=1510457 RepID=A0A2T6BMT6_9RHOB|nr:TetR family transcriptional regulator [Litoreibacter ponti]